MARKIQKDQYTLPDKSDVGLSNVDNTSDATKNSASAVLTNKTLGSGTVAGADLNMATYSIINAFLNDGSNTFPTFNQNTTGSAATLTTSRTVQTNLASTSSASFNGSANITPGVTGILAATNGGTGNGFTAISGPASSTKTFTLPNATATILTDNAAVTVAQGGTGRATGTTAYGLVAVGTTATGAQQTISPGTSGQFLKSAGASALASFATLSSADLSDASSLVTLTGTQTQTNKRITPRVGTTASSSTPTPTGDSSDMYTVTALAANATFAAPSGTPTDGQQLLLRIKDNGTARTLAWNAIYRFSTDLAAPTTTVLSKTLYMKFIYNSADSKWDCLAWLNNF